MKSILEFNLPEDRHEFETAIHAVKYISALDDIQQYIRSKLKYEENTDREIEILEHIRSLTIIDYEVN